MEHAARAQELFDREYWVAAIDEASLGLSAGPPDARTPLRLLIARALERLRQYPSAIRYLGLVLADNPQHGRALAHRGAVMHLLFQKDRAKTDLNAALAIDPDYAYAWEFLFYVSFDTGDDATCDRALEQLERLDAITGYVYRLRGNRRIEKGDRAGGEHDLRKACAHAKGDAMAGELLQRAGFELRTGDEHAMVAVRQEQVNPVAAVASFQKALELGVSTPRREVRSVERLGTLLKAQGRADEALAAARGLTDRHPDRADAWLTRAAIDNETASFQKAHELSPKDGTIPYAQHLLATGHENEALAACTARAADDPDDAAVHRLLGELQLAIGQRDDAKAAWRRAETLGDFEACKLRVKAFGPERGLDHFEAALALLDRRMRVEASAEFDTAARLLRGEVRAPGDAPHRYLAKSLYNSAFLRELKVPDEQIEPNLREAVELDPAYADAMLALGNLCVRTNRVEEGLTWFARAGECDPSAGQPWYYRARHFAGTGAHEQAVVDATKAFDAYARCRQGQFAADAVMIRGNANEALGRLQDALRDYDLAYEYGHPTGYAMGDQIRERIAIEDPASEQAGELLGKVADRIESGECPWGQIEFLESRTASSEKATALVAKLKSDTALDDDETEWLVDFLYGS